MFAAFGGVAAARRGCGGPWLANLPADRIAFDSARVLIVSGFAFDAVDLQVYVDCHAFLLASERDFTVAQQRNFVLLANKGPVSFSKRMNQIRIGAMVSPRIISARSARRETTSHAKFATENLTVAAARIAHGKHGTT
jgi:hypothetical protein